MRTTRRVLCPQDQAFLHANVAIPAGVMRDEPIQRGDFLVVLHAVALWPPKLFYAICPSIVCHDLLLSSHFWNTRTPSVPAMPSLRQPRTNTSSIHRS